MKMKIISVYHTEDLREIKFLDLMNGKYMIKEQHVMNNNPFNVEQKIIDNYKQAKEEYRIRKNKGQVIMLFD